MPSLPKTNSFTLKLGDVEEQVNLNGDMWCRVTEESSLSSQETNEGHTAEMPGFTVDHLPDLENDAAEAELPVDNWLGWPEVDFSIMDCPQSFTCILQDDV